MERYTNPDCKPEMEELMKDCPRSRSGAECWLRLCDIEDILGDEYDLDLVQKLIQAYREGRYIILKEPEQAGISRLRELAQADREGRCVVLPCKKGDTVWRIVHDATPHVTKDRCTNINVENREVWVHLIGDRVMGGWNFGKLLFLNEKEAEVALKAREQDGNNK